jgi:hypothetical protein
MPTMAESPIWQLAQQPTPKISTVEISQQCWKIGKRSYKL